MLSILFFILQIILLILFFSIIILFIFWSIGNFKNKVPFVSSSNSVFSDIAKALDIKDDSVVYDIGCGDGRVLLGLSRLNKKARFIGIENNTLPFILAKIESYFNFKKNKVNIEIINGDFFKKDLSNATHVFTYLYPNVMDDLLSKFDNEFKKGTRLVSLSFQFTNKRPIKEIDLNRGKYKLGRKIYVYEF